MLLRSMMTSPMAKTYLEVENDVRTVGDITRHPFVSGPVEYFLLKKLTNRNTACTFPHLLSRFAMFVRYDGMNSLVYHLTLSRQDWLVFTQSS